MSAEVDGESSRRLDDAPPAAAAAAAARVCLEGPITSTRPDQYVMCVSVSVICVLMKACHRTTIEWATTKMKSKFNARTAAAGKLVRLSTTIKACSAQDGDRVTSSDLLLDANLADRESMTGVARQEECESM